MPATACERPASTRSDTGSTNIIVTRLVVTDEVLQANVGLSRAEVRRQEGEEGLDALVDAVVGLLRLQVS